MPQNFWVNLLSTVVYALIMFTIERYLNDRYLKNRNLNRRHSITAHQPEPENPMPIRFQAPFIILLMVVAIIFFFYRNDVFPQLDSSSYNDNQDSGYTSSTTILTAEFTPECEAIFQPKLEPGVSALVMGEKVNYREASGGQILGQVHIGEVVTIFDGPFYFDCGYWWNVTISQDGVEESGTIMERLPNQILLEPLPDCSVNTQTPLEIGVMAIVVMDAKVRPLPRYSDAIALPIDYIVAADKEIVELIDGPACPSDTISPWWRVKTEKGVHGWMIERIITGDVLKEIETQ